MSSKKLIVMSIVFGLTTFTAGTASAHTLESDGPVGAVLHIDPDDDPVAGQPSEIYFEVKDRTGKFNADDCDCIFTVSQNGSVIEEKQVQGTRTSYVFPAKSVYNISLSGQPAVAGIFEPFELDYDIRVDKISSTTAQSDSSVVLILFGAAAVLLVVAVIGLSVRKKPTK